jgi:hypothetical protein
MAVALSCVGLATIAAAQEHLQRRAESFALSGADALSGRIGGYACQLVHEMAANQSLGLNNCAASGLEIRVVLTQKLGGLTLSARAHAGPPFSAANLTSR